MKEKKTDVMTVDVYNELIQFTKTITYIWFYHQTPDFHWNLEGIDWSDLSVVD